MSDEASSSSEATPADFEHLIGELERIVGQLERGELSLEASLVAFERGMEVSRRADDILGAAEARVEQLLRSGGPASTAPLGGDTDA